MTRGGGPLLKVEGLRAFHTSKQGLVKAVDDVSFEIFPGEAVGLLGESGSGKTSVALSILGLFEKQSRSYSASAADELTKKLWAKKEEARKKGLTSDEMGMDLPGTEGHVWFKDQDLLAMDEDDLRKIRGERITYVPQGTSKSLNPSMTIEDQTGEPITIHYHKSIDQEVARKILEVLEIVDLGDMEIRKDMFPTDFSSGEDQRVMIATSLITKPDLIIADEPTTAVDGAVRNRILSAINIARKEMGLALLMITNNSNIVAETCDKVGVMSSGRLMEFGDVETILKGSRHPFTRAFLMANPNMAMLRMMKEKGLRLQSIKGSPPSAVNPPPGCPFHTRCEHASNNCSEQEPEFREIDPGHWVFCHWADGLPEFLG
ncbi:MAG: oligopeptide/dipeptide ABC transporter ATP-binding protein [Candidatus Thorarchaeota archaeon]|jgi:oligopeptide/dipeptide ABC transporter ATP-binding protein